MKFTREQLEELRDEFEERKPKPYRCVDRMCGALDCANCFPFTYNQPTESEDEPSE